MQNQNWPLPIPLGFQQNLPNIKNLVWFCWLTILWTTCNQRNPGNFISLDNLIQCDSTSSVLFCSIVYLSNGHWIWELVLTILVTLSISDALPTSTTPFPIVFFSPPYSYKKGALSLSFSSCRRFFCSLCIPIFSILVHLRA